MSRRNFLKKILKKKKKKQIVNVDDDEENFVEEISLQNDEHDNNINLDGDDQTRFIKCIKIYN